MLLMLLMLSLKSFAAGAGLGIATSDFPARYAPWFRVALRIFWLTPLFAMIVLGFLAGYLGAPPRVCAMSLIGLPLGFAFWWLIRTKLLPNGTSPLKEQVEPSCSVPKS